MNNNTGDKTISKSNDVKEIDIFNIINALWSNKTIILKSLIIFIILGLVVSFFSEKEYTAEITIVPQTGESKALSGNIGGLAAMAGINLGNIGGEMGVSPILYPKIVKSVSFQLELLKTPLSIERFDKKVSYSEYYSKFYSPSLLGYMKKYTLGLPGLIIKSLKTKNISTNEFNLEGDFFIVSIDNKLLLERLEKQLTVSVNEKEGFVVLSANMPEAKSAAELVYSAQKKLQDYIIKFKIEKSQEQLKFIIKRYKEKEKEFTVVQKRLASFIDENKDVTSALAKTKLEQLRSEYDLVYNVFLELAKQVESQKIKVKEDTPVFTVIDPISIPFERSFPKRGRTMLLFIILGVFVGVIIIGVKSLKKFLKNNL